VGSVLRDVVESDLDAFFEYQREPEATRMALFPARDREAFDAHWRRVLADETVTTKTIVHEGEVAGNIGCWSQDGRRLVGYWLGSAFWGRGLATRALAELVEEVEARPLHAWVARSNVASIRVLEKCGFVVAGSRTEHDEKLGEPVEELLLELA
jgi:RimJ/RimL family protein N-acetyltransferase